MLVGSEPDDDRLHEAIETAGGTFVAEINEAVVNERSAASHNDALVAVAARAHRRLHAARTLLCGSDLLTATVRALQPDGAILWLTASDTGLAWEAPRIEQALRAAGCPVLKLLVQGPNRDAETLRQIATFVHTLEAQ